MFLSTHIPAHTHFFLPPSTQVLHWAHTYLAKCARACLHVNSHISSQVTPIHTLITTWPTCIVGLDLAYNLHIRTRLFFFSQLPPERYGDIDGPRRAGLT